MRYQAPNHFSYNFRLNLDKLPTKRADRISLMLLLPGLICGLFLIGLGGYELLQGQAPESDAAIRHLVHTWFSLTIFDLVIIALGACVIWKLIVSYLSYKKVFFDGKKITLVYRNPWGKKSVVTETIKKYAGVRFRVEFFQYGFINKNKYIIELYHKDSDKIAPLYISTSGNNIRKIWKDYALKLNLPEVIITDEGLQKRKAKDLDKSLAQLYEEGLINNDFSLKDHLPESVSWVRTRDKSIIKNKRIHWDIFNIFAAIGMGCLFLFMMVCLPMLGKGVIGYLIWMLLLVATGLCFLKLITKDKLVIKPHKIVIVHKTLSFSRKKDELAKEDIQSVDVAFNPATNRYFLAIIGADKTLVFGKKLAKDDLRWVKNFLIHDVIKK